MSSMIFLNSKRKNKRLIKQHTNKLDLHRRDHRRKNNISESNSIKKRLKKPSLLTHILSYLSYAEVVQFYSTFLKDFNGIKYSNLVLTSMLEDLKIIEECCINYPQFNKRCKNSLSVLYQTEDQEGFKSLVLKSNFGLIKLGLDKPEFFNLDLYLLSYFFNTSFDVCFVDSLNLIIVYSLEMLKVFEKDKLFDKKTAESAFIFKPDLKKYKNCIHKVFVVENIDSYALIDYISVIVCFLITASDASIVFTFINQLEVHTSSLAYSLPNFYIYSDENFLCSYSFKSGVLSKTDQAHNNFSIQDCQLFLAGESKVCLVSTSPKLELFQIFNANCLEQYSTYHIPLKYISMVSQIKQSGLIVIISFENVLLLFDPVLIVYKKYELKNRIVSKEEIQLLNEYYRDFGGTQQFLFPEEFSVWDEPYELESDFYFKLNEVKLSCTDFLEYPDEKSKKIHNFKFTKYKSLINTINSAINITIEGNLIAIFRRINPQAIELISLPCDLLASIIQSQLSLECSSDNSKNTVFLSIPPSELLPRKADNLLSLISVNIALKSMTKYSIVTHPTSK